MSGVKLKLSSYNSICNLFYCSGITHKKYCSLHFLAIFKYVYCLVLNLLCKL